MARFHRSSNSDTKRSGRSVVNDASAFKDLLLAYVRQETLDPLKALGRFLLFGVIGAVFLSLGWSHRTTDQTSREQGLVPRESPLSLIIM